MVQAKKIAFFTRDGTWTESKAPFCAVDRLVSERETPPPRVSEEIHIVTPISCCLGGSI